MSELDIDQLDLDRILVEHPWVIRDREWAPALHLLFAPMIRRRTMRHVNLPRQHIDWKGLEVQSRGWSTYERLFVETAYQLWSGRPMDFGATLTPMDPLTLIRGLDASNGYRFVEAIRLALGHVNLYTLWSQEGTNG